MALLHANKKGIDKPAHPSNLISAFLISSLESIIAKLDTRKVSIVSLASVIEQTLSEHNRILLDTNYTISF